MDKLIQEYDQITNLDHPNIIKYLFYFYDESDIEGLRFFIGMDALE